VVLAACDTGERHSPVVPEPVVKLRPPFGEPAEPLGDSIDPPRRIRRLPPPPISGGTLLLSRDETLAFVADPDRDRLFVVDLNARVRIHEVEFSDGDEPGRAVEDEQGRVHVVLRGGGAVASIDPSTGTILGRHPICAAPRGIDYSDDNHRLTVACAGGELISFSPADGTIFSTLHPGDDLRDVVVHPDHSMDVTTFRSAQMLHVVGDKVTTTAPPPFKSASVLFDRPFVPEVAWRARAYGKGIAMLHQRGESDELNTNYSAGDGTCGSVVHAAFTILQNGVTPVASAAIGDAVLPVDFAISPDGSQVAIVAAGIASNEKPPQIAVSYLADFKKAGDCHTNTYSGTIPWDGTPVAVAWAKDGTLWAQTREPAGLQRVRLPTDTNTAPVAVRLSLESRDDPGHDFFHHQSGKLLACASCHPEGGEDGRTWQLQAFPNGGPRRTQSLRSHVLARAPFHWTADKPTMNDLLADVFVMRMGGMPPTPSTVQSFSDWIDQVQRIPIAVATNSDAVARGALLFTQDDRCTSCHSGPAYTNLKKFDVGTGSTLKVPSLVGVSSRLPLMHDGCAATLADRFGPCGGGGHASNDLTDGNVADLVAFLKTL
jgi:DNA-binding beta-propeller fold protein YncE